MLAEICVCVCVCVEGGFPVVFPCSDTSSNPTGPRISIDSKQVPTKNSLYQKHD